MEFTPSKINLFVLTQLPAAYLTGVRLESINESGAVVRLRHRWMNQNPFRSIYFAVQLMAAELSTGVLVMRAIAKRKGEKISMLVASNSATYTKKATGVIRYSCWQADVVEAAIEETLRTKEGVKFVLESTGVNANGETVVIAQFEWTIKAK